VETRQRMFEHETELLAARTEQLAAAIDAFHLGYQRAAARLAAMPKVDELMRAAAEEQDALRGPLAARLAVHGAFDPAIRGVAIVGLDRRVIATTEPALDRRPLGWRFVADALAGSTVISDVFVSEHAIGDVPTIAYAAPVRGPGEIIGAVVFWVRAEALWDLVQRADHLAGADSFGVVLDHDGIRVARTVHRELVFHPGGPLPAEVVTRLVAEQRFGANTRALLDDVQPIREPFARARAAAFDPGLFEGSTAGSRGVQYGVGRRLATVPWTVFYMAPEAVLDAPVEHAAHRHLAFAMLVAMLALLAGGVFARQIAAQVARLTTATRRLARGELSTRVDASGHDELAALGAAFNTMAAQLYQSHVELEATVGQRTSELVDANRALREREHSLAASEQRFRDLYENSPDMYATIDADSRTLVDCNRTLCTRLGYDRAELLGQPFSTLYHPEFLPELPERMTELRERGEVSDCERVLRCKDGRSIVASVSLRTVRDRDGRIVQVQGVWRDIAARKRVEADQQFLLGLTDVLRSTTDAGAVIQPVCTRLASYLGASRCLFAEIDLIHGTALIHRDYHGDQASVSGVLPLSYFGREPTEQSRQGATVVIADTATDPRTRAAHSAAYQPIGVRALVSVPLLRHGDWITSLMVTSAAPRTWQDREIAMVKLVAERVWAWVEHLRLLAELREQSVRDAERDTEARLLRTRQSELARSLKEREVLLQEIHHRVKNNLQVISSLINMQTRKLEPGASRDALEQCQTRVLAIALIHEKLYQSKDYSAVHFAEYTRSLAANVFHAIGVSPTDVALELAIDDIPLGVDRAIPCGLVLNELITNALKHAFSGRCGTIRVALTRRDGGRIRLQVDDDGAGLPPEFDIHQATSMGFLLVCTLAEQLEAELAVVRTPHTSFQLTFVGDA
ncbi:MAG TPA: histidine kinase dimerization/phosphoacceptor domain -containing protein, partial [Kofleriaceae bacterium]|nr:histidine kinase dimerization/phosphoacceptor domain -containing protein [Kofleriaceae bacterium]